MQEQKRTVPDPSMSLQEAITGTMTSAKALFAAAASNVEDAKQNSARVPLDKLDGLMRWHQLAAAKLADPTQPLPGGDPTQQQIAAACVEYRRDFEALNPDDQRTIVMAGGGWLRAWRAVLGSMNAAPASLAALPEATSENMLSAVMHELMAFRGGVEPKNADKVDDLILDCARRRVDMAVARGGDAKQKQG